MKNKMAVVAIAIVGIGMTGGFTLAAVETRGHTLGGVVLAATGGVLLTFALIGLTQIEP